MDGFQLTVLTHSKWFLIFSWLILRTKFSGWESLSEIQVLKIWISFRWCRLQVLAIFTCMPSWNLKNINIFESPTPNVLQVEITISVSSLFHIQRSHCFNYCATQKSTSFLAASALSRIIEFMISCGAVPRLLNVFQLFFFDKNWEFSVLKSWKSVPFFESTTFCAILQVNSKVDRVTQFNLSCRMLVNMKRQKPIAIVTQIKKNYENFYMHLRIVVFLWDSS